MICFLKFVEDIFFRISMVCLGAYVFTNAVPLRNQLLDHVILEYGFQIGVTFLVVGLFSGWVSKRLGSTSREVLGNDGAKAYFVGLACIVLEIVIAFSVDIDRNNLFAVVVLGTFGITMLAVGCLFFMARDKLQAG